MHDPKTCILGLCSGWGYNHPIVHSPSSPFHIYPRSHICRRQTFSESLVSSVTVALPTKARAHYFFSPARRPADDSNSQTHPSSYEQESDEILTFVVVSYGVCNSTIPNCTMRLYSHTYDTASSHCRVKKVRYGTTTIYITAEVGRAKSYRYRTICVAIYLHDMGVTAACGRLASHWQDMSQIQLTSCYAKPIKYVFVKEETLHKKALNRCFQHLGHL